MAAIWQAPDEIKNLVTDLRKKHHNHLDAASFWVMVSDGKGVRDNKLVATVTQKCTKTEKLSSGADFKITVIAETWSKLTDMQREIAIDEALTRCGVAFEPETVEINGKKEILKDDLGRTIYSEEMAYDKEGNPKWKIMKPDADLFFSLIGRYGKYSEEADNVNRVFDGKPIKGPVAAQRADDVDVVVEA